MPCCTPNILHPRQLYVRAWGQHDLAQVDSAELLSNAAWPRVPGTGGQLTAMVCTET